MAYLNNDKIEVTSIFQFSAVEKTTIFLYGTTRTVNLRPLIFN